MKSKPIGPAAHGALDYGFVIGELLVTHLVGLKGKARTLSYAFIATTALVNSFSKHRFAIRQVIPMRVHGLLETGFVPSLLLLPWALGALEEKRARRYFGWLFVLALTNYLLTDYSQDDQA